MPSVEHSHRVHAPVAVLWDYVENLSNWARDIPGYLSHGEITADESVWTVRGDVGMLSRKVNLRVTVTQRIPARLVAFTLEGLNEQVAGTGTFRTLEPDGTALLTSVEPAEPSGSWWRRWIDRALRRWFVRSLPSAVPSGQTTPAAGPGTEFVLALTIEAGGLMGPVVNAMLGPLLEPAAIHLAERIASGAEGNSVVSGGAQ